MAAFTPDQQAILYSITRIISVKLGELVNLIERTNMHLVALHNILGEKGVITAEEWNAATAEVQRSEEHTSELQSQSNLVCRLLLEKKKKKTRQTRKRYEQSYNWIVYN